MITYRKITRIYNEVLHVINEEEHHILYGTDDRECWLEENKDYHLSIEQELILTHLEYMGYVMGLKISGRKLEITLEINKLEDEH